MSLSRSRWDFRDAICKVTFCPECGTLLDLPEAGGVMKCRLCKYVTNAKGTILRAIFN